MRIEVSPTKLLENKSLHLKWGFFDSGLPNWFGFPDPAEIYLYMHACTLAAQFVRTFDRPYLSNTPLFS